MQWSIYPCWISSVYFWLIFLLNADFFQPWSLTPELCNMNKFYNAPYLLSLFTTWGKYWTMNKIKKATISLHVVNLSIYLSTKCLINKSHFGGGCYCLKAISMLHCIVLQQSIYLPVFKNKIWWLLEIFLLINIKFDPCKEALNIVHNRNQNLSWSCHKMKQLFRKTFQTHHFMEYYFPLWENLIKSYQTSPLFFLPRWAFAICHSRCSIDSFLTLINIHEFTRSLLPVMPFILPSSQRPQGSIFGRDHSAAASNADTSWYNHIIGSQISLMHKE